MFWGFPPQISSELPPPWETRCIFAENLIFWSDARPHLMLHLLGFVFGGK